MLAFGPDGYLYIGMGDGGGAGIPGNRAQNLDSLLGKILRIDVNGMSGTQPTGSRRPTRTSARPAATRSGRAGLRNPWRFSFDRVDGTLWIGDVGQGRYEEIDRSTKPPRLRPRRQLRLAGPGGHALLRPQLGLPTTAKTPPIAEYSHAVGACAVTGGYAYHGTRLAALPARTCSATSATADLHAADVGIADADDRC